MEIPFSFTNPAAEPTDHVHEYGPPSQTTDGEEYICGNAGPAFEGHTAGRDQDRSRADEYQGATPFARYIG